MAHFSKYGLQDSDEEEDVPPKTDPKKLKTMMSLPSSRLQQQLPPSQQQVAPQAQVEQPATVNTHLPHPHRHAEMIKGAFHSDLCLVVAGVSSAFSSSDELSVQTTASRVFSPHKVKLNVHQHNNDQLVLIIPKV